MGTFEDLIHHDNNIIRTVYSHPNISPVAFQTQFLHFTSKPSYLLNTPHKNDTAAPESIHNPTYTFHHLNIGLASNTSFPLHLKSISLSSQLKVDHLYSQDSKRGSNETSQQSLKESILRELHQVWPIFCTMSLFIQLSIRNRRQQYLFLIFFFENMQ